MPTRGTVDHYAALNLPPTADFTGVENAYARLSNELASQTWFDETATAQLMRVNEAYSVLSRPELRSDYDKVFRAEEFKVRERAARARRRRQIEKKVLIAGAAVAVLAGEASLVFLTLF
jgi:curved DNA-binding protein CbpA